MEGDWIYEAASLQGVVEMFWRHFWGAVMSAIFIYLTPAVQFIWLRLRKNLWLFSSGPVCVHTEFLQTNQEE